MQMGVSVDGGRGNGEVVGVTTGPVRVGGRVGGGGGIPLTRQQLYRSRNFLHQDLQLPEGYGEHRLEYAANYNVIV